MKISYTWEAADITPGKVIYSESGRPSLIGYSAGRKKNTLCVIDCFNGRDGLVNFYPSAKALAENLTKYNYSPFKPLKKKTK